jgi:hypothetical protein
LKKEAARRGNLEIMILFKREISAGRSGRHKPVKQRLYACAIQRTGEYRDHDKNGNQDIIIEHVDMNVANFPEYISLILILILILSLSLGLSLHLRLRLSLRLFQFLFLLPPVITTAIVAVIA